MCHHSSMNKVMHKSLFVTIPTLVSLLAISHVFADNTDVVDEVTITVPVSCTMSGTGMTSHTEEIANGTYESEIGTTTIHAFCNDSEGFAIYAAGYTGNEIGGTNSNKLVGTSASSNATIVTGLATSTPTPDVSNWAMKLAIAQDSGDTTGTNAFSIDSDTEGSFSIYHTVPNEYTKVAHKNSNTDMTAVTGGVKLTTTYAAYISKTQPADTYTGQVIYTLIHPAFANAEGCNPNGTTISTILCMQDISSTNKSTILTSMTTGTQYTLKDNRDGKTYFVARQADDSIWMTQNLDLCIGCEGVAPLTSENTDLNSYGTDSYNNGYSESNGIITWTPSESAISSNHTFVNGTITRSDYSDYTAYSAEGGDLYFYTSGNNNSDTIYQSEADCVAAHNDGTCPHYHIGNYYSRLAAIASNVADNRYTGSHYSPASNSICPAGWRLPFGRIRYQGDSAITKPDFAPLLYESGVITTSDFSSNSYTTDGFNKVRTTPLFFTRTGDISWQPYSLKSDYGHYQTSSGGYLLVNLNFITVSYINDDGDAGFAIPVRCLVR